MLELEGRHAFITGGASGIGRCLALALLAEGMCVTVADINADALARLELPATPAQAGTCVLDVADLTQWENALDAAEAERGPVDLLCNNAGVAGGMLSFLSIRPEIWRQTIDINLHGVYHGSWLVANRLVNRQRAGHIVNTASLMGLFAAAGSGAYCASKFGVVGLSEIMRAELASHQIGVSVLCPGAVGTDIGATTRRMRQRIEGLPPEAHAPVASRAPAGEARMRPEAVAARVIAAIKANEFYILTHPEYAPHLADRANALSRALGASAQPGYQDSPAVLAAFATGPYHDWPDPPQNQ